MNVLIWSLGPSGLLKITTALVLPHVPMPIMVFHNIDFAPKFCIYVISRKSYETCSNNLNFPRN